MLLTQEYPSAHLRRHGNDDVPHPPSAADPATVSDQMALGRVRGQRHLTEVILARIVVSTSTRWPQRPRR